MTTTNNLLMGNKNIGQKILMDIPQDDVERIRSETAAGVKYAGGKTAQGSRYMRSSVTECLRVKWNLDGQNILQEDEGEAKYHHEQKRPYEANELPRAITIGQKNNQGSGK
jgi:hypothetical protein